MPDGYILKEVQTGIKQNKEDVIRLRYGLPDEDIRLYGSHYSAVFKVADQSLLGFMSINQEGIITNTNDLPSKEETTQITKDFLEKIEPGYFTTLDNMWVNQHDEPIVIDGQEQVVSGNKYKAYVPSEGSYLWVVVDKNQKIIIFERGIIWESGRTTEKWLYDEYLLDGTLELFAVKQN